MKLSMARRMDLTNGGYEYLPVCNLCYLFNQGSCRQELIKFCDVKQPRLTCKYTLSEFITKISAVCKPKNDFGMFFRQVSQLFDKNHDECKELFKLI